MSVGDVDAPRKTVTIALIGDSTVTDQSGWGKAFAGRLKTSVKVLNLAAGGRSSKSWYNEGRLPQVLEAEPDYVLMQFGHNDQPGKGAERETEPVASYQDYLTIYVEECRKIGSKPIIISSVTRRTFDESGSIKSTLTPWAKGSEAVAKKLGVPFIDLHALSVHYHNRIGPEASMVFNPEKGDMSHFNQIGSEAITDLIFKELNAVVPEFAIYLKRECRSVGSRRKPRMCS